MSDYAYYADSRVIAAERGDWFKTLDPNRMTATVTVYDEDKDEEYDATVPVKREVCSCCDGRGSVVNPSIDAGGLAPDDLEPEEWETYWSGGYDQPCPTCHGNNVEYVLDRERADNAVVAALDEEADAQYAYEQERAAERRMGC